MYGTEEDLRLPIREFFSGRGFRVYDEPRLMTRNIDVVAQKASEIHSVELKIRDWKRAIAQAYLNLRVADYSYVALPESVFARIDSILLPEVRSCGVGLISVNGVARELIQAQPSTKLQPHLRQRLLKELYSSR